MSQKRDMGHPKWGRMTIFDEEQVVVRYWPAGVGEGVPRPVSWRMRSTSCWR